MARKPQSSTSTANIGFEQKLWLAADKLRSNMDAAEYISIYGQESNATTRRLRVMSLALRGIEADSGPEHADTFRRDLHPDRQIPAPAAKGAGTESFAHLGEAAFLNGK